MQDFTKARTSDGSRYRQQWHDFTANESNICCSGWSSIQSVCTVHPLQTDCMQVSTLLTLMQDSTVDMLLLDLRDEDDYAQYHLKGGGPLHCIAISLHPPPYTALSVFAGSYVSTSASPALPYLMSFQNCLM